MTPSVGISAVGLEHVVLWGSASEAGLFQNPTILFSVLFFLLMAAEVTFSLLTQGFITGAVFSPIPGKTEVPLPYASSLRSQQGLPAPAFTSKE